MTDSNATGKRNIICDLPDYPDGEVTFELVTFFAAESTEGFPQKNYVLDLDEVTGQGTQALPVPSSGAWLWKIHLPDSNKPLATLAAGADIQLTAWLSAALSTETANSLTDTFVLKAGDTMTGLLTLSGAPTADLHASTKKYVDDNIGGGGGAGDMAAATYDPAAIEEQLVGLTATQALTNKNLTDFTNDIDADDVHVQVRNESGGPLAKGTPVHASGYSVGQEIVLVEPADASSAATMPAIGILAEELGNNATGGCIIIGREEGIDTSAFSDGDELYVSETAGELTATKPTGTALIQKVATVLRVHATLGVLQINSAAAEDLPNLPQDNSWFGDANGVPQATTPANARMALGVVIGTDVQAFDADTAKLDVAQTWSAAQTLADNELIRPKLKDYSETPSNLGDTGGGTVDIDFEDGNFFSLTVSTSTTTFTFSNPPASGSVGSFTLEILNGGSQTVNWPASVTWAGGTEPTLTAAGVDVLTFYTRDGGTTYRGFAAGLDMS